MARINIGKGMILDDGSEYSKPVKKQKSVDPLPFTPPFRLISEYRCGTDAHVVDSAGNIIIEASTWVSDPETNHKAAMMLIVDVLNDYFPENEL